MRGHAWLVVSFSLSGAFIVGFCVYVILVFDPLGWGTLQSRKFTWEKFSRIKAGDSIVKVIDLLGKPVDPPQLFSTIISSPNDPCSTGECHKYLFAGAAWGASFKEAIVIVDSEGRVVHAEARQE